MSRYQLKAAVTVAALLLVAACDESYNNQPITGRRYRGTCRIHRTPDEGQPPNF